MIISFLYKRSNATVSYFCNMNYQIPLNKMKQEKGITRREALKRMGLLMAGSAASITGVSTLTACDKVQRKRIILYFTGTGNCLYVARQLADKETEILSIPQMLKQSRYYFEADEIGVVYPIYGHMPPNMVRNFIKQAKLKASYKFAILTYGNRKCDAAEIWQRISQEAGNPFDYITTMIMVDNWLPNFDMNEQIKIDKGIPANLRRISEDLSHKRKWHEPVTEEERIQHQEFLQRTGLDPAKGFQLLCQDYFVVTDRCIGCAACVEVCPRGNYKMTSQGVKMEGDCEFCFACIQNCPQKAIGFSKGERNLLVRNGEKNPEARYRNEHVSLWDIKASNRQ